MKQKYIINFWKSELERPNCYYCGAKKTIGDWTPMSGGYASNGESWWYRPYGCPSPQCSFRCKESLISCTTSFKNKADRKLNRKLYGYKLNLTNMRIIKNTIKIIVLLVAIFVVVNIFWWLFGGMISKIHISPLVITKTITNTEIKYVPVDKITESNSVGTFKVGDLVKPLPPCGSSHCSLIGTISDVFPSGNYGVNYPDGTAGVGDFTDYKLVNKP